MVYESISENKRNTFFLMLIFILVIVGLGYLIGELYGNPYAGIVISFLVSVFSVYFSYYYSDSIIMTLSGASPADRAMHGNLINSVEGLALAAGIRTPLVYVVDSEMINAFATGRDPNHAAIAVTTGAYVKLNKQELEAVVAHEMSHIKNYDILVGSVAAVLVGTIVILSDVIKRNMFRSSMGRAEARRGIVFVLIAVLAALLAPLVAMIINYAVSRQREFLADAQACLLTRYPPAMIDALIKIKKDNAPAEAFNKGIEHMYFTIPAAMRNDMLFSTHPPLDARIARIQGMDKVNTAGN